MKKRILFAFLVLSITPFARGCNATVGFPLPIAAEIFEFNMQNFLEKGLVTSTIFLLANIIALF